MLQALYRAQRNGSFQNILFHMQTRSRWKLKIRDVFKCSVWCVCVDFRKLISWVTNSGIGYTRHRQASQLTRYLTRHWVLFIGRPEHATLVPNIADAAVCNRPARWTSGGGVGGGGPQIPLNVTQETRFLTWKGHLKTLALISTFYSVVFYMLDKNVF